MCEKSRCNIKFLPCEHTFHARCIFPWPVGSCPCCNQSFQKIEIGLPEPLIVNNCCVEVKSSSLLFGIQRKGRWTDEEKEYADALRSIFASGSVPLMPETKLVNFLTYMLQCSPTRLSSKIKTGKRVYHPRRLSVISSAEILHFQNVQKQLSSIEEAFINKLLTTGYREVNSLPLILFYLFFSFLW